MLKNQKGFTLIEALIALSITSILILATSTSFMKLYDYINRNQTLATIVESHNGRSQYKVPGSLPGYVEAAEDRAINMLCLLYTSDGSENGRE